MGNAIIKTKSKKQSSLSLANGTDKVCNFLAKALLLLLAVIYGINTFWAFCTTAHFKDALTDEHLEFRYDDIALNIVILLLFVAVVVILGKCTDILNKINLKAATVVLAVYVFAVSLWWVLSVSSGLGADSAIILGAAKQLSQNDFTSFHSSYAYYNNYSYFQFYPFQLGYVLLGEIVYRIFGTNDWFVLEFMNVLALTALCVALVKLVWLMFKRKSVTLITIVALAGCFQAIFFTTFSYGNLLGLASGAWAMVFAALYIQKEKKLYVIPCSVLMALSVIFKYNNLIIVAAIAIVLLLHAVSKRRLFSVIALLIVCIAGIGGNSAVIKSYELRSGVQLSGGVSQTLYLSMGLNESDRCPGWYNGEAMEMYRDSGLNITAAEQEAKKKINSRLSEMFSDPTHLQKFLSEKMFSQWNEPTYESVWISEVKNHINPVGSFGKFIYSDSGKSVTDAYFNFYQQIIFFGFTVAMIAMLHKKLNLVGILPAIAIMGGFLYHMLFEAKSQYVLTYFILMIPYAAYGFYCVYKCKITQQVCVFCKKTFSKGDGTAKDVNTEKNNGESNMTQTAAKATNSGTAKQSIKKQNKKDTVQKKK